MVHHCADSIAAKPGERVAANVALLARHARHPTTMTIYGGHGDVQTACAAQRVGPTRHRPLDSPTLHQTVNLLFICLQKVVPGDVAERGVLDGGGDLGEWDES